MKRENRGQRGTRRDSRTSGDFHSNIPYVNAPLSVQKPFVLGEFTYSTDLSFNGDHEIEKFFHNYDLSFHNELWASTFFGNFATGLTWNWERVFWWENSLNPPPPDPFDLNTLTGNPFQPTYSNAPGFENIINIGSPGAPVAKPIKNQKLYHHFQPLDYLINHPSLSDFGFFNTDYSVNKVYSNTDQVECYFLKDPLNKMAVGWVHNLNAWTMNNFYLANIVNNFLGCTAPFPNQNPQEIEVLNFLSNTDYYIT